MATNAHVEWSECPAVDTQGSAAEMQCGWLHTGEKIEAAPVRLRFAVLRARPGQSDREPVIHLPGGPGESAGLNPQALAGWRQWQQRAGWPHDIVLFDPRGTGESQPPVRCNSGVVPPWRNVEATIGEDDNELTREAARAARCRRRLGDATAAALGPDAQLRDLKVLIDGLGFKRVNLWAVSYGTRLARLFESRHPQRVASLVLDSLVPFTENELLAMPRQLQGAIEQLAVFCDQPASRCASSAPARAIEALLARYRRSPAVLRLGDARWAGRRFEVTPYRLLLMILFASYEPGRSADTVQRIERALSGDAAALRPLAARLEGQARNDDRSEPVFWSTRCALDGKEADEGAWRDALVQAPLVAPYVAQARQASVCDRWPVPEVEPPATGEQAGTPTLVVSGTADRITPPAWSDSYALGRPNVKWVDVPGAAHVSTLSNACAQRVVGSFLRSPEQTPVVDCTSEEPDQSGR
ncbi:alpha/beta fold hydrolase [Salinisphaera dokdonensis]